MRLLFAVLAAAVLAATGCEYLRPELQNPSNVEERAFEDIPVPSDFVLDRESREGFSYSEDAMRTGQLEYKGGVPAIAVAKFYRYQMPLAGWAPRPAPAGAVPNVKAEEPTEMEFTKGRYLARVRITESRRPFSNRPMTRIAVTLQTD